MPTDAGTVVYNLRVPTRAVRKLDLVFVLDTSPSMAAKQRKLAAAFPKFIADLTDPCTGELPDLRAAIIDSNMGAEGMTKGDLGKFQFPNAVACGVTDARQPWLFENRNADPLLRNFTSDFATVFACIASAVGTGELAFSQPLKALESAFYDPSNVALQRDQFLRPDAYLGIVIVTDQDDCSAGSESGIFTNVPAAAGESASLRCTTRASVCNGQNLSMSPPGCPAAAAFTANLTACTTRTDFCGADIGTSQPTDCNPLMDFRTIADEIKQLKADPDNQLMVTGIFGWPLTYTADVVTAQLIIDQRPNPDVSDTAYPQIFDIWPICYDPSHQPADPTVGFDPAAAALGGNAGLRISAFVDEFGANGMTYSICAPDLSMAMEPVGWDMMCPMHNLCIDSKLLDTDLAQPGVQASCKVWLSVPPVGSPGGAYAESPPFPQCDDVHSVVPCWQVTSDIHMCPDAVNGQRIQVYREAGATTFNQGTIINVQCQACPDGTASPTVIPGCDY